MRPKLSSTSGSQLIHSVSRIGDSVRSSHKVASAGLTNVTLIRPDFRFGSGPSLPDSASQFLQPAADAVFGADQSLLKFGEGLGRLLPAIKR